MSLRLKQRISSPLEAGTSILDAHHLPPHILPALEHVSEKLSRKALHLSLVVVRRDYQLPSVLPPVVSPVTPLTPGSPRLRFGSALRQLVRGSPTCLRLDTQQQQHKGHMGYPSSASTTTPSSPRVWPKTPMTPMSPPPLTPCTPSSMISMTTGTTSTSTMAEGNMSSLAGSSYGVRLVFPPGLSARDERTARVILQKAARKFDVGNEWLPNPVTPAACGLPDLLIHRSILQNDVLFSSEGLTLLSLHGLYSLKSALSAYTKTKSPLRLEDAVDELRRLVLAANGRKVTRAELLRSYDWLSVSHSAIEDLDRMYKRAYGGVEQVGAIAGMGAARKRHRPVHEPFIRPDDEFREEQITEEKEEEEEVIVVIEEEDMEEGQENIGLALTTGSWSKSPPTPKIAAPVLKLQTNFDAPSQDQADDGELTAKPVDQLPIIIRPWPVSSIDQVLSATVLSPARSSMRSSARMGPKTPNGYEDISPITRGEWGFLTTDNVFRSGKTAAVETF